MNRMVLTVRSITSLALAGAPASQCSWAKSNVRPNIVFLLADEKIWRSAGCRP